ncbi:MAG: PAS domain-containing protein [Verrucomicrobia bacterium]|nr:PAS domain-containing protein [Verrucomicrobiota bacterium]
MPIEPLLRRIAVWAAWITLLLGAAALLSALLGADFLRPWRIEPAPMKANAALCLLLTGAALAAELSERWRRASLVCAGLVAVLGAGTALEHLLQADLGLDRLLGPDAFAATTPGAVPGRMNIHASLMLLLAAGALGALRQQRHRSRWPVSAVLANLLVALAVAALVAQYFRAVTEITRPLRIPTHQAVGLLVLGVGVLLARPEDKFVRMLFERGTAGVLARRLFFGTAVAPLCLTVLLPAFVQARFVGLGEGVGLLLVGLMLCGFVIALFSAGAAVEIQGDREEAEQARLLLTARLQEQAAQLQETVGVRTRELREANASLRAVAESNALLAAVAEHTTNGVVITDAGGRVEWINAAYTRVTGYTLDDLKDRNSGHVLPGPGTDAATVARLQAAERAQTSCRAEILNYSKTGRAFWSALELEPVRDRHGQVTNFIALSIDVTEQRAAQERLQNLNDRLALATRAADVGVWEWDAASRLSQWDARTLEIYGVAPERYTGTTADWLARVHPADRDRMIRAFQGIAEGGSEFDHEFRIVRGNDGAVRHIESRGIVQRDAAGRLERVTGTERDVTAQREAAHQADLLNERLRLALRSSNYGVWALDITTDRLAWDEQTFEIYGVDRRDFTGSRDLWRQHLHPADAAQAIERARRVLAGEYPTYDNEFRIIRPDGAVRHIEVHGYLQRDATGRPVQLVGLNRDITERKLLEERVRKSEELAADVARVALIGGWEYHLETSTLTWTDGLRRIHEVEDDFSPTLDNTRRFYPPDALATLHGAFNNEDPTKPDFDYELPLVTAAGHPRWVRVIGRTDFRADGKPVRVHGAMQDITVRHESERSRRELETQLFQAQKMETLGTLAGGIAHDFNNLLTGIIGYHELAADSVAEDHPARMCLAEARNASLRARELVEQILTFGRQSPGGGHVPLDLGPVAEEARRFLRSTLPAMISIELDTAPDTPPVLGDATQIHQVLLNLGSNAAHAMRHHGGKLTISIAPAAINADLAQFFTGSNAGSFVRLSVRDTGHGMDEATRRRIFDPFFTTKNTREGTGLGLAVVHGIIKAHRGAIDVESKPGAGAAFHIYLPAATPENDLAEAEATLAPRGDGEFICIVDDEEVVGTCTKLVLESKGYVAVVYRSAEDCLSALRDAGAGCSLLVTDQTMPGMQGTELVAAIRKLRPTLPVLIMSGYFSKISPEELDELGQVELLAKPFTTDELTNSVHRALHPAPPV